MESSGDFDAETSHLQLCLGTAAPRECVPSLRSKTSSTTGLKLVSDLPQQKSSETQLNNKSILH
jgi:hypothetical protein